MEIGFSTEDIGLFPSDVVIQGGNYSARGLVLRVFGDSESSDSEEEEESSSTLPEGHASICWLKKREEEQERIENVRVVDRFLTPGDTVCWTSDPLGQSGFIIQSHLEVELEHSNWRISGVDSQHLRQIRTFQPGMHVIWGNWLGKVEEVKEKITVAFEDCSRCIISDATSEELFGVHEFSTDDENKATYYPGQRVCSEDSSVFKNAEWTQGHWKASHSEGTVVLVEPGQLKVKWMVSKRSDSVTVSVPPPSEVPPDGLIPLNTIFSHDWQIGDWTSPPLPLLELIKKRIANNELDKDLNPCLPLSTESEISVSGFQIRRISRSSVKHSKRKGVTTDEYLNYALRIMNTETKVEVQWQDGSKSLGVESTSLFPVYYFGDHDFWPGEYVMEKETPEGKKARIGHVKSVDSKQKIATVHWVEDIRLFSAENMQGEEQAVSVYEISNHPDYDYKLGNIVIRLLPSLDNPSISESKGSCFPGITEPTASPPCSTRLHDHGNLPNPFQEEEKNQGEKFSKDETISLENVRCAEKMCSSPASPASPATLASPAFPANVDERDVSWVGQIVGFDPLGVLQVRWGNGKTSAVAPHEIYVVTREEDEEEGEEEEEEEEGEEEVDIDLKKRNENVMEENMDDEDNESWETMDEEDEDKDECGGNEDKDEEVKVQKHSHCQGEDFHNSSSEKDNIKRDGDGEGEGEAEAEEKEGKRVDPFDHTLKKHLEKGYPSISSSSSSNPFSYPLSLPRAAFGALANVALRMRIPSFSVKKPETEDPLQKESKSSADFSRTDIIPSVKIDDSVLEKTLSLLHSTNLPQNGSVHHTAEQEKHGGRIEQVEQDHIEDIDIRKNGDGGDGGDDIVARLEGLYVRMENDIIVDPEEFIDLNECLYPEDEENGDEDVIHQEKDEVDVIQQENGEEKEHFEEKISSLPSLKMGVDACASNHASLSKDPRSPFPHFDIVKDASDHYFLHHGLGDKYSDKSWSKRVQKEWEILQNNLPDTIWVRVYEERMDLMRAAIVGSPSTPYWNCLFFFDIFLPPRFPHVPPSMHYHSFGLKLNPNLYENGRICLSLINTWNGKGSEIWQITSSILQILVSIQGLVLVPNPYFNEAGYEKQTGTPEGEKNSRSYTENAFLLSCKSIISQIRNTPEHFDKLVRWHFQTKKQEICGCCQAYSKGLGKEPILETQNFTNDIHLDLQDSKSSAGFKLMVGRIYPKLIAALSSLD